MNLHFFFLAQRFWFTGKEKDIWECDLGAQEAASLPDRSGLYRGASWLEAVGREDLKGSQAGARQTGSLGRPDTWLRFSAHDIQSELVAGLLLGTPPASWLCELVASRNFLPCREIIREIKIIK